jgi:hypothetical protein
VLALCVALIAAVLLGGTARLGAQQAGTTREVSGRVVRPAGKERTEPVSGVMVTLHRVGRDSAGPLDSARSGPDGRFAFRYRPFGEEEAVYFVSSSYAGIAYFSAPLRAARVTGDDAELMVFDTTSTGVQLSAQGRHVVVAGLDSARRRRVIEVFELSNDSGLTRVAGPGDEPSWRVRLPANAQEVQVGQGDVSPDAVTFADGAMLVFAPFAPGIKQVSVQYLLPAASFPLSIPVEERTGVLEVLLEDPQASAEGGGLREVPPADAEGRHFRRYLAQDVPAGAVVRLQAPTPGPRLTARYTPGLLTAIGLLMLLALWRALSRMSGRRAAATPAFPESPERLARRIADLDAAFERESPPSDALRADYERRRAALKARLSAALASRDGGR